MNQKQLGVLGEKIAVNYLKKKGYQILDRNYPREWRGLGGGEIDVIAIKDKAIGFIEVKALLEDSSAPSVFQPEDRVNFQKQKKLARVAQMWLNENKIPLDSKWQIDVIAIKVDPFFKKAKLRHFKNI